VPLSDQAWHAICAAAGREPDGDARAKLESILFQEYPAFAYDRDRVAAAFKHSGRMLEKLEAFARLYRQTWLPQLPLEHLDIILDGRAEALFGDRTIERDLWCIARLHQRTLATRLAACAIQRAYTGRKSIQREWLYHRLCGVWLDYFHAPLTYSVSSRGGPPHGSLIAFMLAAIRQIMPEQDLPKPATIRDAIIRERAERKKIQQLTLQLRRRMPV
jgi:hypothetical protein